jgi:hypothetical protein
MTDHSHWLVAPVLLVTLTLTASPGALAAAAAQPTQVEPAAGGWSTWLLDSGAQFRPEAAPGAAATQIELPIRSLLSIWSLRGDPGAILSA